MFSYKVIFAFYKSNYFKIRLIICYVKWDWNCTLYNKTNIYIIFVTIFVCLRNM